MADTEKAAMGLHFKVRLLAAALLSSPLFDLT
jgi:hypothetical protein